MLTRWRGFASGRPKTLLTFGILLACLTARTWAIDLHPDEHAALLELADSLNWRNASFDWTDANPCSWTCGRNATGYPVSCIVCNETSGHVEQIQMSAQNLTGTLPAWNVPNLFPQLTMLSVWNSAITGGLPSTWGANGSFPVLTDLQFHINHNLHASLPGEWGEDGRFPQLVNLLLYDSGLQGTLPPQWGGGFKQLQQLSLSCNSDCRFSAQTTLQGTLPDAWGAPGSFPQLQQMWLWGHCLQGEWPASWQRRNPKAFPNLQFVHIQPGNPGMCGSVNLSSGQYELSTWLWDSVRQNGANVLPFNVVDNGQNRMYNLGPCGAPECADLFDATVTVSMVVVAIDTSIETMNANIVSALRPLVLQVAQYGDFRLVTLKDVTPSAFNTTSRHRKLLSEPHAHSRGLLAPHLHDYAITCYVITSTAHRPTFVTYFQAASTARAMQSALAAWQMDVVSVTIVSVDNVTLTDVNTSVATMNDAVVRNGTLLGLPSSQSGSQSSQSSAHLAAIVVPIVVVSVLGGLAAGLVWIRVRSRQQRRDAEAKKEHQMLLNVHEQTDNVWPTLKLLEKHSQQQGGESEAGWLMSLSYPMDVTLLSSFIRQHQSQQSARLGGVQNACAPHQLADMQHYSYPLSGMHWKSKFARRGQQMLQMMFLQTASALVAKARASLAAKRKLAGVPEDARGLPHSDTLRSVNMTHTLPSNYSSSANTASTSGVSSASSYGVLPSSVAGGMWRTRSRASGAGDGYVAMNALMLPRKQHGPDSPPSTTRAKVPDMAAYGYVNVEDMMQDFAAGGYVAVGRVFEGKGKHADMAMPLPLPSPSDLRIHFKPPASITPSSSMNHQPLPADTPEEWDAAQTTAVAIAADDDALQHLSKVDGADGDGALPTNEEEEAGDDVQQPQRTPAALLGSRAFKKANSIVTRNTPRDEQVDLNINVRTDIKFISFLGRGAFGAVYRALWRAKDGRVRQVAVKMLDPTVGGNNDGEFYWRSFREELDILSRIRHPHIVRCYGGCIRGPHPCIVLEYMEGGSLDYYLHKVRKNSPLAVKEILEIACQIASGLAYLHPTVVHRDLKPQNVLLGSDGVVKLGDFGLSKMKDDTFLMTSNIMGTPAYTAPEVFKNSNVSEKCDTYALGVLMWECFMRERPWKECNLPFQIMHQVLFLGARPKLPDHCPQAVSSLINKCWDADPNRRLSCSEVVKRCRVLLQRDELLSASVPSGQLSMPQSVPASEPPSEPQSEQQESAAETAVANEVIVAQLDTAHGSAIDAANNV